jgi:hypothetical protein
MNAIILLDMGHRLRGKCTHRRDKEREGNQKLECS